MRPLWVVWNGKDLSIGDRVEFTCALNLSIRRAPEEIVSSFDVDIRHLVPRTSNGTVSDLGLSLAATDEGFHALINDTLMPQGQHVIEAIVSAQVHFRADSPVIPVGAGIVVDSGLLATEARSMPGGIGRTVSFHRRVEEIPAERREYVRCVRVEMVFPPRSRRAGRVTRTEEVAPNRIG